MRNKNEPMINTNSELVRTASSAGSVWKEIGLSWLAIKTWVKFWLFFLNGVMLASLAFLYDPLGHWTLVAYAATGPLLAAFMIQQRGLTRLLGVAHLVPWTPFLIYVALRIGSRAAGPRIMLDDDPTLFIWAIVLLATVGICLAFDAFDVVRWIRGERFVLGSEEAYQAGASFLTRCQSG